MYAVGVEGGQRPRPVPGQPRPHRQRVAVPYEQRQQPAGGQHPRQPRQQRVRLLDVHQDAVAEHHVEAARQEVDPRVPAVALDEPHPAPDALGLGGERLPGRGEQFRVTLEAGHRVPGPGQPQRLRALAHAHVEDPQPLPDREASGYLLVELPGDQLLSYDLAQSAQPVQPGLSGTPGERRSCSGPLSALDLRLRQPEATHLERAHQGVGHGAASCSRRGSARPAASSDGTRGRSSRPRSARSRTATAAARCSAVTPPAPCSARG